MNATVAQIKATTPTPTPMPALAPVLRSDEESVGLSVCFVEDGEEPDVVVACVEVEEVEGIEVGDCAADLGTEVACAGCTLTDPVAEEPGIV